MKSFARMIALVALFCSVPVQASAQSQAELSRELDALWAEVSRTVSAGDAVGYGVLYHPDAVVVTSGGTQLITQALAGWNQGFMDTAAGRMRAGVEFRITERRAAPGSAFDIGIFRYVSQSPGGQESVAMVHFEALMVKKDGRWLMIMENQKHVAAEAEWAAAAGGA